MTIVAIITAFSAFASWQTPAPQQPLLMADPHICVLPRGPYCIIMGEGENIVNRRRHNTIIRIRYDEDYNDVIIIEPLSCENSITRAPYLSSISRRRSRIFIQFYLNPRCDITVSAPDHHIDAIARGIVIALTQIHICMRVPCEGRPLATLISRRALGWPD
jgi:hypothetical protein